MREWLSEEEYAKKVRRREWIPEDEFNKMLAEQKNAERLRRLELFNERGLPEPMKEIIEKETSLSKEAPPSEADKLPDKFIGHSIGGAHVVTMIVNGEEVPVKVATLK